MAYRLVRRGTVWLDNLVGRTILERNFNTAPTQAATREQISLPLLAVLFKSSVIKVDLQRFGFTKIAMCF